MMPRLADVERQAQIMAEVQQELHRAQSLYPSFSSPHEGYAIILEELDELWDEIKLRKDLRDTRTMRKEAIQVAAMAIRFLLDVAELPNA